MPIRRVPVRSRVVRQRKNHVPSSSALGLFETENLAALRIDPGHDVPNGAVFPASVHPLKDQQQRLAIRRVVKMLQRALALPRVSLGVFDTASSICRRASNPSSAHSLSFDLGSGRTWKIS